MKYDVYVALDNGATGSIGIIHQRTGAVYFSGVPTITVQDYTQRKKNIDRIDKKELQSIISKYVNESDSVFCYIERPMKNPARFEASISAARAFESTVIIMEELNIGYEVIDSRIWQKKMLPSGTKGEADLKQASFDVGIEMHPELASQIIKQNDADALLMVEYAKMLHCG